MQAVVAGDLAAIWKDGSQVAALQEGEPAPSIPAGPCFRKQKVACRGNRGPESSSAHRPIVLMRSARWTMALRVSDHTDSPIRTAVAAISLLLLNAHLTLID